MPSTVARLLKKAGLQLNGKVNWGEIVTCDSPGVYIVSLSPKPDQNFGTLSEAPISEKQLEFWIKKVPAIEIDGKVNPSVNELKIRLSPFWLPDESILYIGMTTATLRKRVRQYYRTELGERKPHAGGHWLKTLTNLEVLYVFFSACNVPKTREDDLLGEFVRNVSSNTLSILRDPTHPFPFANLEYPEGTRKNHGVRKSKL